VFLYTLGFHKEKQNTETVSAILWSKYIYNKPKFCIVRDKNLEKNIDLQLNTTKFKQIYAFLICQNVSELGLQDTSPES